MAIKATWTGSILIGKLPIAVKVKTATEADKRDAGLKRLCSCCEQPFTQDTTCPAGNAPETDAAIKRGDPNLTPAVHGIEVADGEYVVIDPEVLDEIAESTQLDHLAIEEVVPRDAFPLHLSRSLYYLAPDDKTKGSDEPFAWFHKSLVRGELVAITKWSLRGGDQKLCAIVPEGDTLLLVTIPFASQLREPDDLCVDHAEVEVAEDEIEMMLTLLGNFQTDTFEHEAFENDAVPARAAAIDEALAAAGKNRKAKIKKVGKDAPKPKGSLKDLLQASIDDVAAKKGGSKKSAGSRKSAPAKKAAAKKSRTKVGA